ncbi:MAG: Ig domain-containing protein [Candidatus Kapaibacterium sp.]
MKKTVFMVMLLLLGIAIPTFAQLKVTLNMSSRPDPYLSNWAERKETVIVTVINSGSSSIRAKFDCKINKEGSLIVNTKPEKMKILDIPSGVSQYYGEDLVPFEAAKIKDGADQTAIKTGMLPAGSYEFCCALLDPQDKQLTAPVCKSFTLQSYQAPVLLQPEDKSILAQNKRPMFRWTGISPKPQFPIKYRLQVFEVLPGQTPINAFRANRPILDRTDIMATQYQWPADVEMPSPKLQHIWTVRALDDKDNSIGEPYGYATPFVIEPCCLKYGDVCCPPDDVTDNGGGVKDLKENDKIKVVTETPIDIVTSGTSANCPRQPVNYNQLALELNKVYKCLYPDNACKMVSYLSKKSYPSLAYFGSINSQTFSTTQQDVFIANAKQYAESNLPICPNGDINWIVTFELVSAYPANSTEYFLGCNVQYYCCLNNVNAPFDNSPNSFKLITPTEISPPTSFRPDFKWEFDKKGEDITYTVSLGEVDETSNSQRSAGNGNTIVVWPFSSKAIFEEKRIKESSLRYPANLPSLDSAKAYVWQVSAVNNKGEEIAKSALSPFSFPPFPACFLISATPQTQSVCLNASPINLSAFLFCPGCSGPITYTWTQLTGSTSTITTSNAASTTVFVSNAGVHQFKITATRGSCVRTAVFTINVYPKVGTITALKDEICHGDDNQLFALNANPPGNWVPITWSYSDNGGSTWINAPTWSGNVGTSVNTNLIFSPTCGSGQPFGIRKYRAQINYGDFGLPQPPPGINCSEEIKDIKVWCPTVVTLTGVSTAHIIKPGNKICSDNNGDGLPNYPIILNLTAGGFGTIQGWTVVKISPSSPAPAVITGTSSTVSYSITGAGTYTFTVTRKNGECTSASASYTVIVTDPPPIPILQIVKHNGISVTAPCPFTVCPNDDATIQVSNFAAIQSASPGALYNWDYLPGVGTPAAACPEWNQGTTISPSWIHAGGVGGNYEQNTNAMYPNITSSQWDYVWWRVYVQDANAGCPSVSACCLIKIIKKPCAPTISLAPNNPNPQCPGSLFNILVSTPTGPNCGPIVSSQWYRNGEPTTPPPFTLPGNYQLVVKGPCDSAFPNVLPVTVRQMSVSISGPCCAPNAPTMKLCVTTIGPLPNCSGPAIIQWRTISPTVSAWQNITTPGNPKCFNVPTPTTTTTYEVRYTKCGCTVTSQFTVTKCP